MWKKRPENKHYYTTLTHHLFFNTFKIHSYYEIMKVITTQVHHQYLLKHLLGMYHTMC